MKLETKHKITQKYRTIKYKAKELLKYLDTRGYEDFENWTMSKIDDLEELIKRFWNSLPVVLVTSTIEYLLYCTFRILYYPLIIISKIATYLSTVLNGLSYLTKIHVKSRIRKIQIQEKYND